MTLGTIDTANATLLEFLCQAIDALDGRRHFCIVTLIRPTLSAFLFLLCFISPYPSIAGPYIEFGVGVHSRDIIEEGFTDAGEIILDSATGVQKGSAASTRVLAEIGWKFKDRVELYGNIGGIDMNIDQFNDFKGDFDVALGGGAKVQ